jgi:hypothetical protein
LSPTTKICERCGAQFHKRTDRSDSYFKNRRFCGPKCVGHATNPAGDPVQRFWDKVVKADDPDDCWGWLAARHEKVWYGVFTVARKTAHAHRFSYELHNGPIPKGKHVLHKCDNPACSNPRHLFLGDQISNNKDRDRKGRLRVGRLPGSKHHQAKLNEDNVLAIRASSATAKDIGEQYGVTAALIYMIRGRKIWRHI